MSLEKNTQIPLISYNKTKLIFTKWRCCDFVFNILGVGLSIMNRLFMWQFWSGKRMIGILWKQGIELYCCWSKDYQWLWRKFERPRHMKEEDRHKIKCVRLRGYTLRKTGDDIFVISFTFLLFPVWITKNCEIIK